MKTRVCLLKAGCLAFDFVGEWRPTIQKRAMNIVEDVILDDVTEDNRFLKPKGVLMKRAANPFRSKMRPAEPNAGLLNYS